MEFLSQLSWMDLVIILLLAGGVFIGYMQGMIRYVLSALVVLVAFVIASQLRDPVFDMLSVWTAFTDPVRQLLIFLVLFGAFVIAGWFIVRAFYGGTRLPVARQLDDLGGAIFGLLFAALLITFHLVVLDTLFQEPAQGEEVRGAGFLQGYYEAMNSSLIVQFFRETLIPTAGYLARPFVPDEIARHLLP